MIHKLVFALCLLLPLPSLAQPFMPGTPRPGTDYEVLPTAQATYGKGKIEVAEVFSYGCIHCFHFQPLVNTWKKTMPADVRWEYVPAAFGGPHDNLGRAFLAAQVLGIQQKTHDAVFKGIFTDKLVKTASPEELADLYATLGRQPREIPEHDGERRSRRHVCQGQGFFPAHRDHGHADHRHQRQVPGGWKQPGRTRGRLQDRGFPDRPGT